MPAGLVLSPDSRRYTPPVLPATIALAFDPLVRIGDTVTVRVETIGLAIVILLTLLVAVRVGDVTPTEGPYVPAPTLRRDDLLFIALGVVPGAVIGGRIGYVLVHADYYLANPARFVDPAQGSLELSLAVLGGLLSAIVVARLIEVPVGRWMHAAALPVLFLLATGKLLGVLGADGQGMPSDLPWATSYTGPGPWGALLPEVPSHPSQVYEAILTALVLVGLGAVIRDGAFARRDGSALLVAIIGWSFMRGVAALTWRDATLAGPFRAEHVLVGVVILVCVGWLIGLRRSASRT